MTRLLVLGLLSQQPMSGYDIQQKIQGADAERWGGVLVGSIYHALKKLEQEGHIALARVERTGRRQRAVYQITAQGEAHLHSITLDALCSRCVIYPTTLYSGLSLLDKLPPEAARQALEAQKKALAQEYDALERGRKANQAARQDIPPLSQITIDNMFAILRLQRQFVEQILDVLGPRERGGA